MRLIVEPEIKYYKYAYADFVQPTMSDSGTFEVSEMAVRKCTGTKGATGAYSSAHTYFQPTNATWRMYADEAKKHAWVIMYTKKELRPTSFIFKTKAGWGDSNVYNNEFYAGTGPGDTTNKIGTLGTIGINKTGTFDLSSCTDYYHYFMWHFANGGAAENDNCYVYAWKLTGVTREPVECSQSEADFFVYKDKIYTLSDNRGLN